MFDHLAALASSIQIGSSTQHDDEMDMMIHKSLSSSQSHHPQVKRTPVLSFPSSIYVIFLSLSELFELFSSGPGYHNARGLSIQEGAFFIPIPCCFLSFLKKNIMFIRAPFFIAGLKGGLHQVAYNLVTIPNMNSKKTILQDGLGTIESWKLQVKQQAR